MILTPRELANLTQRTRSYAQARVLDYMAIPYRRRPDGSLVVLRAHLDAPQTVGSRRPNMRFA